jgi:hypothetical protein
VQTLGKHIVAKKAKVFLQDAVNRMGIGVEFIERQLV